MLCQCCVTLKIRYRILFHFQQRYFNVDPTLKCWLGHRGLIILKDIEDIFTAKCFYIPLKVFKIFFLIATFLATWTTCLLKFPLSAAFMLQDEEGVHYISIRYLKNYVIMTFFGTFPVILVHASKFRSSRPEMFYKKAVLRILQNSQENTCARISPQSTLLKKRLWCRCFPVNFAKFLRALFLIEYLWWLIPQLD